MNTGGYNLIMSCWVSLLMASALAALPAAGQKTGEKQKASKQETQEQEPPEEDVTAKPKVYAFNPLQATKEVQIGNYYFKKGSWNAAAMRFREATKWNPGWVKRGCGWARRKRSGKTSRLLARRTPSTWKPSPIPSRPPS